jgi:hypothetical protein
LLDPLAGGGGMVECQPPLTNWRQCVNPLAGAPCELGAMRKPAGGAAGAGMSRIWGVAEYRAKRGMKTGGRVGDAALRAAKMVIAPPS